MGVVLAVTGHAIRRQCGLRDIPHHVAGLAIETFMRSSQRVARLSVMIIAPALPAIRIVTRRAIRPQTAFVMSVAVASVAIQRGTLELQ